MEDQIVSVLAANNGHLSRGALWLALALPDARPTDEYWAAEQSLVDAGRLERRRGRTGGIYLLEEVQAEQLEEVIKSEAVAEEKLEKDHYQPVLDTILSRWTEQPGFTHVFGSITASQGRRATGGRWSRPDIVLCTISDWLFSSRAEGDVRTIEVKPYWALDTLAVFEALSHKARAHYAYLLIVDFPEELDDDQKSDMEVVLAAAARHGIGVITANRSDDWDSWVFELDARKSDADPQAIHQLLLDQVPKEARDKFRAALRSVVVSI